MSGYILIGKVILDFTSLSLSPLALRAANPSGWKHDSVGSSQSLSECAGTYIGLTFHPLHWIWLTWWILQQNIQMFSHRPSVFIPRSTERYRQFGTCFEMSLSVHSTLQMLLHLVDPTLCQSTLTLGFLLMFGRVPNSLNVSLSVLQPTELWTTVQSPQMGWLPALETCYL